PCLTYSMRGLDAHHYVLLPHVHVPFTALRSCQPPSSFFLIRLPPRSTPSPYTTLFRSMAWSGCRLAPAANRVLGRRGSGTRRRVDRKSTRLNSSHVKISYAVFCLKKKTRRRRRNAIHCQTWRIRLNRRASRHSFHRLAH